MDIPIQIADFIVNLSNSNKQHSTIKICAHDLSSFFKWIEKNKPAFNNDSWVNLERKDYDEYFAYLKEKNSSDANLRRVASHLNSLLRFYGLTNRIGLLKATEQKQRALTSQDFAMDKDIKILLKSVVSEKGLSESQREMYKYLAYRNLSILVLMINYGLTINEVRAINMKDINFAQNTLDVGKDIKKRQIKLSAEDKKILYRYFTDIPLLLRPKDYTDDPFFIAFHPRKMVFWYDYNKNSPRRISDSGIKRIIENEVERSGINHGIRSTHFRNSCVLSKIKEGWTNDRLISYFGLTSRHALYRYKRYLKRFI